MLLGYANPHRTVLIYVAGAIVMTVIIAAIVFVVLRAGHLQRPQERHPRYGLRLGLGLAMLLAGGYLRRRGPKRPDPGKRDKGIISRLLTRPGGTVAFIIGLIVYTPSLTFIAAVQVVATARSSLIGSVLAIALVIVITVMFAWLPFLLYLLAPGPDGPDAAQLRRLAAIAWLRADGRRAGDRRPAADAQWHSGGNRRRVLADGHHTPWVIPIWALRLPTSSAKLDITGRSDWCASRVGMPSTGL